MLLGPSLANLGDELVLVGAHLADEGLVAGFFMARGPENHFSEHRCEVNSFGRQGIQHLSTVLGILPGIDDFVGFETAQAVGQDVGGDFFVGVQKFAKGFVAAEHHVAQDQQRPTVSEHFDGGVERTTRAAPGKRLLFRHEGRLAFFACNLQVRLADCRKRIKRTLDIFPYRNVM